LLRHLPQPLKLGRFDAAKYAGEIRITQIGEKVVVFRDVEGRLECEGNRKRMLLLPGDQMRDQLAHGAAGGDEILVEEIKRGGERAGAHLVELGDELVRPLHARHPTVEAGNIAELAREGAS